MTQAAGDAGKPMILINPKLVDLPSSGGVMGVRGRQERQDFVQTFENAYHFRLLYLGASAYPIMGALRHAWGGPWEVFKRVDIVEEDSSGGGVTRREEYQLGGSFGSHPSPSEITECFRHRR